MSTAAKPARKRIIPRPKNAAERKARVNEILRRLDEMYPHATCALIHRTPWELLVATILSAQCTDKRVNEVTPGLFEKYPTPQDFAAVRPEVLANDIRSTGFFNNKAKSVVGAARKIVSEFGGEVPRTMEQLLTVPGAARKTANVVLGTAYGIAVGVVVHRFVNAAPRRVQSATLNARVRIRPRNGFMGPPADREFDQQPVCVVSGTLAPIPGSARMYLEHAQNASDERNNNIQ